MNDYTAILRNIALRKVLPGKPSQKGGRLLAQTLAGEKLSGGRNAVPRMRSNESACINNTGSKMPRVQPNNRQGFNSHA